MARFLSGAVDTFQVGAEAPTSYPRRTVPLLSVIAFLVGAFLVLSTGLSAVRTFVLPRGQAVFLTRLTFHVVRWFFDVRVRFASTYEERDAIMALFAPLAILSMPLVWLIIIIFSYTAMFWAIGSGSLEDAFELSGSSLLTIGFAHVATVPATILALTEAAISLVLLSLLVSYIPAMYGAFSHRETAVSLLEVRAGSPPSAVVMLKRYVALQGLDAIGEVWRTWELWFAELTETHTSLAPLSFFRSPDPHNSWVTASGAILDAASLTASTLDVPRDVQVDLCLRAGFIALQRIAALLGASFNQDPAPTDPISITRAEFDEACATLAEAGVPLRSDRDQAWRDFAGWRVNYDAPLILLAAMTRAPMAPWSSDRSLLPTRR